MARLLKCPFKTSVVLDARKSIGIPVVLIQWKRNKTRDEAYAALKRYVRDFRGFKYTPSTGRAWFC